jgi:hypothetical protein
VSDRLRKRMRQKEAAKLFNKEPGPLLPINMLEYPHPDWMTRAFSNNRYVVMIEDGAITNFLPGERLIKVMIQRHDDQPIPGHWREIYNIKNELFGRDALGVEFYPPERQLVDDKNIYWLWILPR